MPTSSRRNVCAFAAAVAALLLLVAGSAQAAPLPGAIFTTNSSGTRVNQNIYPDKCSVYLDGGPGPNAPPSAAGLPEGDYYFQVTDPSGKTLLSTDPVSNRRFHVSADGVITAYTGFGGPVHPIGTDTDHASLGAITIQLANLTCPADFLDTPNNGGVYKAWVTRVADFVGNASLVDNGYNPGYFHGFLPAASKTDNFKVGQRGNLACLTIQKFKDFSGDGRFDSSGADYLLSWPITVLDPNGAQINGTIFTSTEKNPGCTLFNLVPGTYTVTEAATDGSADFIVTANILDNHSITPPELSVLVVIRNNDRTLLFGNDWKCGSVPFCP